MHPLRLGAVLLSLLMAGCATGARPLAVPTEALATPSNSDRYIVVAVANEPQALSSRPGSTGRGYGGGTDYVVSDRARRTMRNLSTEYHLQSVAAWPIGMLQVHCAVMALPAGVSREDMLARLRSDRRVALAEPLQDYAVQSSAPDPYAGVQAGNERMDIAAAHRVSRGRGVRIAVIDTGLASDHPDLVGRIDVQRNFVDADARRFQLDRHGTAVAGVIAADADNGVGIAGVAPEARLLALKACWQLQDGRDEARCNTFTLAQALASAVELKANIINLSLTGPPDPLLSALAERAVRAGIIIVGPQTAGPSFPGSLSHILDVARSEDRSTVRGVLQAPGREVLTLAPGGRYDFFSGSSIATGEITGITALLLARVSGLDVVRTHELLSAATDTVMTAEGPMRSVNACRALAAVIAATRCAGDRPENAPSGRDRNGAGSL